MEKSGSRIHLFGTPVVIIGGRDMAAEMPAKGLALVGYLSMEPGWHRREHLAGLLWGEMESSRARANLRTLLYELKRLVPGLLEIAHGTVRLDPAAGYQIDLVEARSLLDAEDEETLWALAGRLRGRFLEGFLPDATPGFDDWLLGAQEHWQGVAVSRLELLKGILLRAGDDDRAVQVLNQILAIEPWNEPAHRELMHLQAARGDYAAAVGQFRRLEAALERELGVTPEAASSDLHVRINRARTAGRDRFPAQPNPFFGRQAETGRLIDMLRQPEFRLITLVGPGGVGKTRLGLHAAEASRYLFLGGVRLFPLADWPAGSSIFSPLAQGLEIAAAARGDLKPALVRFLRGREILLVLDHFEHLVDQGGFLAELLAEAPGVKLLVTSRTALGLRWEHRLVLEGLPVPPGEVASWRNYPSAALFIDAAGRVDPSFSPEKESGPVVAVARIVEGFPLALEIAAALTAETDAGQIAERLQHNLDLLRTRFRDVPERQRSLWAAFEASWELLDGPHQDLLARLSVFRGGFDPEAAAAVAGADPGAPERLVSKSLLRHADGRFTFHELVRWFAARKLEGRPFALDQKQRHARFFAARSRTAAANLYGHTLQAGLEMIRRDHANLRAAWDFCVERGEVEMLEPLLECLLRYYDLTSLFKDGEALFAEAAEAQSGFEGTPERRGRIADLRNSAARFLNKQGRFERAMEIVAPIAGDPVLGDETRAFAYLEWGWALWHTGQYADAETPLREAQKHATRAEHPLLMANALRNLGIVAWYRSRLEEARDHTSRALEFHEMIGDLQGVGDAYNNLALISGDQGDYAASLGYLRDAIRIKHEIGDRNGEVIGKANLSVLYIFLGKFREAEALLNEAILMQADSENPEMLAHHLTHRSGLNAAQGRFEQARRDALRALELARQAGDRHVEAFALQYAGLAGMNLGEWEKAETDFEESLALRREAGLPEMVFQTLDLLAVNALERGQEARAGGYLAEMLALLDAGEVKNARILLAGLFTCHRVLAAQGRAGAGEYLEQAHRALHAQADRIVDAELRRSFLENIRLHVEIESAWDG